MSQVNTKPKEKLVKLKVVAEKYMPHYNKRGKAEYKPAPWNHVVTYNGVQYKAGEIFEVQPEHVEGLLASGTVQSAFAKPKPFNPRKNTHEFELVSGIKRGEDVRGKVPTRMGAGDKDAPWVEDDDE